MTDKYFVNCPESGFETYETEAEAIKEAKASIEYFRENAIDGWSEEVDQVRWGIIKQHTIKTCDISTEEAAIRGIYVPVDCDGYVDYDLKDI